MRRRRPARSRPPRSVSSPQAVRTRIGTGCRGAAGGAAQGRRRRPAARCRRPPAPGGARPRGRGPRRPGRPRPRNPAAEGTAPPGRRCDRRPPRRRRSGPPSGRIVPTSRVARAIEAVNGAPKGSATRTSTVRPVRGGEAASPAVHTWSMRRLPVHGSAPVTKNAGQAGSWVCQVTRSGAGEGPSCAGRHEEGAEQDRLLPAGVVHGSPSGLAGSSTAPSPTRSRFR